MVNSKDFQDLFAFDSEEDQLSLDAHVLSAKFLSEVQKKADTLDLKRKELAKMVGTSSSYLTQLFRGQKFLNMLMAARFQKALNIEFEVRLVRKTHFYTHWNDKTNSLALDALKNKRAEEVEKPPYKWYSGHPEMMDLTEEKWCHPQKIAS